MQNYDSLNNPQFEAVKTFDAPVLVLAGAGSGKTRVITAKIAEIIKTGRAHPFQILAVTFTNKAANEMIHRIRNMGVDSANLNIGTFHSICVKMLRRFANLIGFGNNFLIADSADQKKIVKDILQGLGMDIKAFPAGLILSFISRVKEQFIEPFELATNFTNFPNIYREIRMDKIYAEYQQILKSQNMMDFDDLLFFTTKLLSENKDILLQYKELFKYILIDEYQDINSLQYRWFKLLSEGNQNICVVGDDDQSIYGWRGADVSIILSFARDFKNAKIVKLEQNYRSKGSIINIAQGIISNNKNRLGKTLFTEDEAGEKVKITALPDSKMEAREITSKIEHYKKNKGYKYNDFAILVRATSQTRILEEAFIADGIPYKIIGGLKFYERREIKDILSYIKLVNGNIDDISMERVLKTPKKGLGDTTIEKIVEYAKERKISFMKACFDIAGDDPFIPPKIIGVKALNILSIFCHNARKWSVKAKCGSMQGFIEQIVKVIEEIRYIEFLKEEDEDNIDQRAANINELLNSMQGFESVDEFLEHISLVSSFDEADAESENSVKMMTMHSSKGLEFPVVFLPGWEEGLFPSAKTVDEGGEVGIEEERRLAYVGITRAREDLFISYSKMRMIYGGFIPTRESMFIAEIKPNEYIDYRDKTLGYASNAYNGGGAYREREFAKPISFSSEIKQKISVIDEGFKVKHKIFGAGIVVKKVSPHLMEVEFESGETKTIKQDFLSLIA